MPLPRHGFDYKTKAQVRYAPCSIQKTVVCFRIQPGARLLGLLNANVCLVGIYEYGQSAFGRYWHLAGITLGAQNVRFRGKSGHHELTPSYPLMTQSGHVDAIALAIVPQNRELDMPDYMFFMHDDARDGENDGAASHKAEGQWVFRGGKAIGNKNCTGW